MRVRYRGNRKRRVRSTTVEIVVEEAYWDPEGYQAYKLARSYRELGEMLQVTHFCPHIWGFASEHSLYVVVKKALGIGFT